MTNESWSPGACVGTGDKGGAAYSGWLTMMIYWFIISATTAVFSILWAGALGVAMLRQFKRSSTPHYRGMAPNPINALLVPGLLTERGKMLRRRYLAGLLAFSLSAAAAGALAYWM